MLTRTEYYFMPYGKVLATLLGNSSLRIGSGRSWDIEIHFTPTTTKSFLFARIIVEWRMPVLRAYLSGE